MQVGTKIESLRKDDQHPSSTVLPLILWTAGAVTILKIVLALCTYGTNDVYTYQETAIWGKALGVQIYKTGLTHGAFMNHPPSMLYVLSMMNWLAQASGIAFPFWLRIPAILADLGSIWLVWKLMGERTAQRSTAWALLMVTAAPVSIMVSGFHGQTDGLLVFLVLLTVYLAEKRAPGWAVGAVFGLSLCVKVAPIIAVPAVFLYQSGLRRRLEFVIATVLVPLIAWGPFLYEDPGSIIHNVLG
jgi:Gpi18-like mannosyltransferase